jgi:hypothetical protein
LETLRGVARDLTSGFEIENRRSGGRFTGPQYRRTPPEKERLLHENDVSAEETAKEKGARLPQAHEDEER